MKQHMQIARILIEYASGKTCHTWYEAADPASFCDWSIYRLRASTGKSRSVTNSGDLERG